MLGGAIAYGDSGVCSDGATGLSRAAVPGFAEGGRAPYRGAA